MFKFKQTDPRSARLLPGLFRERAEMNRAYLMELKTARRNFAPYTIW